MGGRHGKVDIKLATEQYLNGSTLAEIAAECDVSISTVYYKLTKAGVEMRNSASDEIWTIERRDEARRVARKNHEARTGVQTLFCAKCKGSMRGRGYKQAGHFCSTRCAAEWAEATIAASTVPNGDRA